MQPNLPDNQSVQASDSPLIPISPQGGVPTVPAPPHSAGAGAGGGSPQQVAEQAKRLVEQYGGDPYKLSAAFGQLKEQYVAEHYHVVPNSVEG
ncbi:MAG TPA: hypothetical protein VLG92_00030 [Candidatus Saccharimonadia bacterium]|nr:hypothetical protein [Candidatus Saccharimonadia bacterium]